MNKDFQKAEKALGQLEFEQEQLLNRKEEARGNVEGFKVALKEIQKEIASALAEESKEGLPKLKETQDKIKDELEMGQMLIPELEKRISDNEGLLESGRGERDALFAELAGKWLAKEKKAFDKASSKLAGETKRLLACFHHLRELGKSEVYYKAIGEAYKYLPATQILRLEDFNSGEFMAKTYVRPAPKDISQVFDEITT